MADIIEGLGLNYCTEHPLLLAVLYLVSLLLVTEHFLPVENLFYRIQVNEIDP